MSSLLSATLGLESKGPRSPRLPRPLLVTLIATMVALYASNSWTSPLTAVLLQAKWLPLGLLGLVAVYALHSREHPAPPMAMLVPMVAILVVAAFTSWGGVDTSYSLLSVVTVGATILCGYAVSALVVASDSRRAYFELLAAFCRVMIAITLPFFLARLNLGRGGGLSAWSDNPNTLAAILAPGMMVFLAGCIERRPGWQFWHAAFLLIGFLLIWATNSRASIIWMGIGTIAFWLYRRGPGLTIILAITGLIVLIGWWDPIKEFVIEELGLRWTLSDTLARGGISPLSGREEVWRIGWDLFWERPLTGYGLGSSQQLLDAESWRFVKHQGLHFHSSYIAAAVEIGIFGFLAFAAALIMTIVRGIADSARTATLPRESWPLSALPFALVCGSMGHAVFESWLLSAGNVNMMLFWSWVWMIHHQSQIQVRVIRSTARPHMPAGAVLPAQ